MRLWAFALAAGIPNELFWELSAPEIEAVIDCRVDEERAATLRAGLIAATILNVNRKRGTPAVQPDDFVRERDVVLSVEEAVSLMDRWAAGQGGKIVAPTDDEVIKFSREHA